MAQVEQHLDRKIDDRLDYLLGAWRELPDAEREIDSWDLVEQIDYVLEWTPKEELLDRLREYSARGQMNDVQLKRLAELEELVARHRPILTRLQQS